MNSINKNFRMTVIMTEDCNMRCKYCYVKNHRGSISLETLDRVIYWVEQKVLEGYYVSLDLFGGEPLLVWDDIMIPFFYKLDKLNDIYPNKFRAIIFTNATLLREDILLFTKQRNYIMYNFSLDGGEELHNKTRIYANGNGTYNDVAAGILLFSKIYNIPRSSIGSKCVLSPYNIEYVMDIVKFFFEELGLCRVDLTIERDNVWAGKEELFEEKMRELEEYYVKNIDKGLFLTIFSIPIIDYQYRKSFYCTSGKAQWGISPKGDIYPCQRFYNNNSSFKIGDVYSGVNEISQITKLFKSYTSQNIFKCNKCEVFKNYNCLGQCIAAAWEANNNILIPIDNVCNILKISYKISKEIYDKLKDNPNYQKTIDPNNFGD